jgi:membrane-associated PAP2 superfamily phosphatase
VSLAARAGRPSAQAAFTGGLLLIAALTLLFWLTDLDRQTAGLFYRGFDQPWPGRRWAWSEWLYDWGQLPADLAGALGWAAFALSFKGKRWRAWRGPGLYLGILLLLGPGLLSNVLAKGLAGRPRPVDTLGFGGIWEFHRPFEPGIPGRGASFISGHASNAWYFFSLYFLAGPKSRVRALLLCLAFGAAMSLARVAQGAHWLSDTLLAGAALWTLAAGLSPLIHWEAPAAFFRRPALLRALAGVLLGWLCVGRLVYDERHFARPAAGDWPPTTRDLPWAGTPDASGRTPQPSEVAVDLSMPVGDLDVAFDPPAPASVNSLPLSLDETFEGQGLPLARERMDAQVLPTGGQFATGPGTLAVRFSQELHGVWLADSARARLGLPAGLPVDARLHAEGGDLTIGPFPAGRRVLLSGLRADTPPPQGFHPFGDRDWLRDGQPPLISLDLSASRVRFSEP